jgi:hypothetical protein
MAFGSKIASPFNPQQGIGLYLECDALGECHPTCPVQRSVTRDNSNAVAEPVQRFCGPVGAAVINDHNIGETEVAFLSE